MKFTDVFSLTRFRSIIEDPRAHPQEVVILVGLGLAIFFLLIVILSLFFLKEPKRKPVNIKKFLKRSLIWFFAWLVIFIAVLTLSFKYTSTDKYCSRCHFEKKFVISRDRSIHKNISCLSCHQRPGLLGIFQEKIIMANRVLINSNILKKPKDKMTKSITNHSCLQCHKEIESEVIFSRGTYVAHEHILAKGYRCTECHNQIAHGNLIQPPREPKMEECMTCHDGKTAFNECDKCHTDRVPLRSKPHEYTMIGQRRYTDCTGCHNNQSCSSCHQMKIPHGPEYFEDVKGHAEEARTVQSAICAVCHRDGSCGQCHFN